MVCSSPHGLLNKDVLVSSWNGSWLPPPRLGQSEASESPTGQNGRRHSCSVLCKGRVSTSLNFKILPTFSALVPCLPQPCPPQGAIQETNEEATVSVTAQLWESEAKTPTIFHMLHITSLIPRGRRTHMEVRGRRLHKGTQGSLGPILGADWHR